MPINQPNVSQLCDALQEFLTTEVAPAVDDDAIKYKLKILNDFLHFILSPSDGFYSENQSLQIYDYALMCQLCV